MQITRKYHFYAAHRNKDAGEKCARIHGHTYHVEVTIDAKVGKNGISILFADIDKVCEPIIKSLDHQFLAWELDQPLVSTLLQLGEKILLFENATSAENLATWLAVRIKKQLPNLKRISLAETESSIVTIEESHQNDFVL